MSWGAVAAIAGGVLGGAGSIIGGSQASSGANVQIGNQLFGGFDPRADPLLAVLNAQSMAQLGFAPDPNILGAASPVNRLENSLLTSLGDDVRGKQLEYLNTAIRALHSGATEAEVMAALTNRHGELQRGPWRDLQTAITSAGFSSLSDLLAQEQAFQAQSQFLTSALQGPALERFGARIDANASINQILSNYPVFDQSNIEQEFTNAIAPYRAQELEQANALGYNPATNLELTRAAGIRDALSILSGRQGLANTALLGLQGTLGAQEDQARGTSSQNLAALGSSANLASQQALALNQLNTQGQLASAQAQGSGLQGLFGGLGGGISQAGLLALLPQLLGAQPGTAGT